MDRRRFTRTLTIGLFAAPLAAGAQQAKQMYRIGYLSPGAITSHGPLFKVFRRTLSELGYTEGQDFTVEYRWAEGRRDKLGVYATELVQLNVDIIMTSGTPASLAVKGATRTIPIVMLGVGDPVGAGLVASLAHPGGNITGFSVLSTDIILKRLELLRTLVPSVSHPGCLWNPTNPVAVLVWRKLEVLARNTGLDLQSLQARTGEEIAEAFGAATREGVDGLIVVEDPLTVVHRRLIAELATKTRLPAIYGLKEFVEAGGLMSYAASYADLYRRAAPLVDKILKGTKPADLPVEQPAELELIINLKTAKALGLTIPPSLMLRADEVIQ